MVDRFFAWVLQLLIAVDQLLHVVFGGPKFLAFGGPCPSADETISSKVGRQAAKGKRWARLCEVAIDTAFLVLARQRGHCRKSIEWDEIKRS